MHAKYEVSISYGSRIIMKVKVDRQTDGQTMLGHIKKVAMERQNCCIITDLILHSVNTTASKGGWGRTFVRQDIHQVTKVVVVSNLWHWHCDDGSGCRGDRGRAGYWLLIGGFTGFLFIIRWQYNCDWNIGYILVKSTHQVMSKFWWYCKLVIIGHVPILIVVHNDKFTYWRI